MRLKHIKLAGFKSFVDPTTVAFPSNLCAVVGPNGCGKSNIIDAVRWVMGESSAKHLRGESMADVIFNGSSSRKPIGQASVELLFDNSEDASVSGKLKGEYAEYSEIAIKRRVTRSGKNDYFLNGVRCRRRDITDIFLGTGLGPRSYGIIEQGIISRLIEAKPEELREYIEEAAGISKYKERRRDTENRMRRTLENLERLTDLRQELDRQLARLNKQSRSAEQYRQFKREQRQQQASLQALRYRQLDTQIQSRQREIQNLEVTLEGIVARQRHQDTIIEQCRAKHIEKTDIFNDVQARFYAIGADIARLEQSIHHTQEINRQLQADLERVQGELQQTQAHLAGDKQKAGHWRIELAEMEPQLSVLSAAEEAAVAELQITEEAMQSWQQAWDEFQQRANEPQQKLTVEQSRIQHLQKSQQRLSARHNLLKEERVRLDDEVLSTTIEPMQQQLASLAQVAIEKRQQIDTMGNAIQQLRDDIDASSGQLDDERNQLQKLRGRYASLEVLQQSALDSGAEVKQWLAGQAINDNPRLLDGLTVSSRWQNSVEMILGHVLQAVTIDDVEAVVHSLNSLSQGELVLVDDSAVQTDEYLSDTAASDRPPLLAEQITGHANLHAILRKLLRGVYISDDLESALALKKQLQDGESVVTPEGVWLGPNWLSIARDTDSGAGILARKQELESLQQTIAATADHVANHTDDLRHQRQQLQQLEQQREQRQQDLDEHNKRHNQVKSELEVYSAKLDHQAKRLSQTSHEITEIETQLAQEGKQLLDAEQSMAEAERAIEQNEQQRDQLSTQKGEVNARLQQARQRVNHDKEKHHALKARYQLVKTQLQSMDDNLARMIEQNQRLEQRHQQLASSLRDNQDPAAGHREQLEVLLEKRIHIEAALAEARDNCDQIEQQIRQAESEKSVLEKALKSQREPLEQLRLDKQTLLVKQQTIAHEIGEDNDLQALIDALPGDAEEQVFEQSLQKLSQRIDRLGPINLAAIDEYQSESERKQYLDAQNDDLCEALSTLEGAIKKIDRETRSRFKATYEQVNSGLKALFPKVFGGGHAYLELTGEDLLDTGITIMARPPGKRNSTIHLLSGGEKALTAVALVFAIFQLNPAPFCMLDEVDAPLDDINVNRYSQLLAEMSDKVQFVFITHNKISMEIAHQLMGVTMHEPGVSRLVTVDIDRAVELAAV